MAILNVTPDSFSDGGRHLRLEDAVAAGCRAADAGAMVLDIGGESTRPRGATYGTGASHVSPAEEIRRVVPVLEALRNERPAVALSVDTRKASVAAAALQAGADIVNVVTGLDPEPELLGLVAKSGAALILNHCRGTPATTFEASRFTDVVAEVAADLAAARDRAASAGVPEERIFLDPGFGFGKDADQNFALLARLSDVAPPGTPLVVGASRKAFLGSASGRPPAERLPESLGAVAVAARLLKNPALVRVHDAEETLRFLGVLERAARYLREDALR